MMRRTFLKIAAGTLGAVSASSLATTTPANDETSPDLRKVAAALRRQKGIVVGVLDDSRLGHAPVPSTLTWQHFRDTWGALPDVHVVPLTRDAIRSYSVLFKGKMDILVYRYGPTYPMDAPGYYTGDSLLGFLKRSGAVLTTGGVPFGNPVADNGQSMSRSGLMPNAEVYQRWVAPLGFKYYQQPVTPPALKVERGFLPSWPVDANLAGSPIGVVVNISSHDPVPKPYHGNVFPERYPARQITTLMWGTDAQGQELAANAVLAQDFADGSRRLHFSQMDDAAHPLAPTSPFFGGLMRDIFALLTNRLAVKDVSTSYACYRDGEPAAVRAEFVSFEADAVNVEVQVEIRERESGKVADTHHETISIPAGKTLQAEWQWSPGTFDADDYVVTVQLVRDGRTVSRGLNGFVVWKDAIAKAGPGITTKGIYFKRTDGETFMLGTNYYESTRGEIMWFRPDVNRISTDLRQMRACGVSYIRPHYHPIKWFKDYLMFQHQSLPPYFASLEKVTDPMPDERAWRIFDTFIYLCQKLGIAYGGDLFTLVPEEMGDPRGWFPMTEALVSEDARAAARKFLRALTTRYSEVPCILWDLWNEPGVDATLLADWTADMRQCLAGSAVKRLITVGSAPDLGASMDFVGLHTGGVGDFRNNTPKPVIAQEVYLDRNEDLASEQGQAEVMRKDILDSVRAGLTGFAPWSWTRQMRLWQDSYEHDPQFRMESWDDRLGCQTHDDGTLKPAGLVFKDMGVLLRSITFVGYDPTAAVVKSSLGQVTADSDKKTLVHINGDKCFAAMATTSVTWKGADIVNGTQDANVYVIAPMDDVQSAGKLYFKCDQPGKVRLSRSMPKTMSLVELEPGVERKVADLTATQDGNAVSITITPTQERYWIAAEW
jgi:hypothetical protein